MTRLDWMTGMRESRRRELELHLANGGQVKETFGPANSPTFLIWPDCSPFLAEYNTPSHLARHIENREYGLRFRAEAI